ncbi:hypothetical protein [Vagococcus intermedius]|uniref:Uncharacterized protein n=1 Tax=Vagococcus intermedius TaxID=2991418 RepID=A0AAF0CTN7_9ENTE|nr:hypothetical protein [Vagococcus intermedius]WEG72642.1 hypothetical protein OL234_06545 [Vagococcus intermedius]WEG74728.1 hypothetical protein OL235_06545 [Vagococcus intermedius]
MEKKIDFLIGISSVVIGVIQYIIDRNIGLLSVFLLMATVFLVSSYKKSK